MSKDHAENWISLMNEGSKDKAKEVVKDAFMNVEIGVASITDKIMSNEKLHHLLPELTMQCRSVTHSHFVFG